MGFRRNQHDRHARWIKATALITAVLLGPLYAGVAVADDSTSTVTPPPQL